jgi:pterin-4a-carbinolamine dehydratase
MLLNGWEVEIQYCCCGCVKCEKANMFRVRSRLFQALSRTEVTAALSALAEKGHKYENWELQENRDAIEKQYWLPDGWVAVQMAEEIKAWGVKLDYNLEVEFNAINVTLPFHDDGGVRKEVPEITAKEIALAKKLDDAAEKYLHSSHH